MVHSCCQLTRRQPVCSQVLHQCLASFTMKAIYLVGTVWPYEKVPFIQALLWRSTRSKSSVSVGKKYCLKFQKTSLKIQHGLNKDPLRWETPKGSRRGSVRGLAREEFDSGHLWWLSFQVFFRFNHGKWWFNHTKWCGLTVQKRWFNIV